MNHRHLGALFLLLLLNSATLFVWHGDSTFRSASLTIHMILGVLLFLGFIGIGWLRHRGRGASFVTASSLAALAAALGLIGVALGRASGGSLIAAHTAAGVAAVGVLAYRWLVEERAIPAARIAGVILVLIAAGAVAGRCRNAGDTPPPPAPTPALVQEPQKPAPPNLESRRNNG